ncbi:RNA-binding S4 domain-containing protein [Saccharicrinis fermentans]|uniref:Heat shock protein 15 n=1 Tax=Saccharicrinis fermentans DSM 9555 = JCM 21142 TaxID=869213 RepID=W7XY33_9BACT|nr:RNA-binding S4 domain-containing protein [Saccharicrinis fermentans]GAF03510.1 heat shock protein 15 [Saccharicrinis fermentans DSM 9555 = JCM 21142]
MDESVRLDKYLWAVRVFKTRSIASEAIKKGRVLIGGQPVKNARLVKVGATIDVKFPPITRSFKVLAISGKRMGAKLVPEFMEEVTTDDQIELLELTRLANSMGRRKGLGRPTKKDRRDLEKMDEVDDWDF